MLTFYYPFALNYVFTNLFAYLTNMYKAYNVLGSALSVRDLSVNISDKTLALQDLILQEEINEQIKCEICER